MKAADTKIARRRIRNSYFTSDISISLVLFLIGLMGLLVMNAGLIARYVKENISLTLVIRENSREPDVIRLQKSLDASPFVKSTEYVSRERAAREYQEELGEDFIEFLGFNPLLATIDVYVFAPYANPDSLLWIEQKLSSYDLVQEVYYQKSLVHLINENVRKISFIIMAFSILMLLIALALINNTIRLSIFAKRFIINTMQQVGATRGYIRRPFLVRSVLHGALGAMLAMLLLAGGIYLLQHEFREISSLIDVRWLGFLFLSILGLGVLMNWLSTYFAVNTYLRLKEEDLYI